MVRTILLATSTLALILICFAIYHFSAGKIDVTQVQVSTADHRSFLAGTPTTQDARAFKIRDMSVSPGEKVTHTYYTPSGEAKVRWRADEWEPLSENEIHLVAPYVEYLMPRGQKVYIEADEAQITMQRTDRSRYDPKHGWLKGNIFIRIDRTDEKWRDRNPERRAPALHPEYVIRIWLDDLTFDLELALLESDGNVRLQSQEATIVGSGLVLRWNEIDNRIEQLDIRQGNRIELRRGGGMVKFAMPGSQQEEMVEETDFGPSNVAMAGRAIQTASVPVSQPQASPTTRIARADSGANRPLVLEPPESKPADETALATASQPGRKMEPMIVLGDTRTKKKKQVDTYVAEFTGDIHIRQTEGVNVVGQLFANSLTLTYDFGNERRDALAAKPGSDQHPDQALEEQNDAGKKNADSDATKKDKKQDETHLVLTWTGPLKLRPHKPVQDQHTGRRFQALAIGSPVRVEDAQGYATCAQLEYHDETQRVWLRGDENTPVIIMADKNRQMRAAREVFFDRKSGIARVHGAGYMKDTREGFAEIGVPGRREERTPAIEAPAEKRAVRINWTEQVELAFRQEVLTGRDPETQALVRTRRTYLESAALAGDVTMVDGEQKLAGRRVNITFGKPRKSAGFADNITRLEIHEDAYLTDGTDQITCEDRLEIDMTLNAARRNVPRLTQAVGNVVVRQGTRRITAKERIIARFASFTRRVPPVSLAKARAVARARGQTPTDEQLKAYLEKHATRTEVSIEALQAYGGVTVTDPEEGLDIRCRDLDCTFKGGQEIQTAQISGTPEEWAYVAAGDFVIEGAHVSIDVPRQGTSVPGAGRLRFWSRQNLDGTPSDEPLPIAVQWTKELVLRGRENYCWFDQDIVARSENVTLRSGNLRIDFFDVPERKEPESRTDYWIFTPLLSPAQPESRTDRLRLFKRPRFLTADRNAVVISSTHQKPEPPMAVDLLNRIKDVSTALATRITGKKRRLGVPGLPDPDSLGPPLSRMRIAGPILRVDFRKRTVNVDGRGSLLIEDYRAASAKYRMKQKKAEPPSRASGDLVIGSLAGSEPSHTYIKWLNSMSFFSERNLAVFDRSVQMIHRAGTEMVLRDDLRKAFGLDERALRGMKGRRAKLTCDNLLVEFLRPRRTDSGAAFEAQMAATELNQFRASGSCHLQEGTKSILGEQVVYNRDANIVTVEGSNEIEARIFNQDERKGIFQSASGSRLRWYRDINRIEIIAPTFISKGG